MTGLGVTHELARSAPANGCAERFNRTWHDRVVAGQTFQDYDELQSASDLELEWINQRLPSRGRACDDQPPLKAYPQAQHPRRPYTPEQELELFSMVRIYQFLAGQHWWRKVSQVGQFSIGGQCCGVGITYANQDVRVAFDPDTIEFVVKDSHGEEITGLKSDRPPG